MIVFLFPPYRLRRIGNGNPTSVCGSDELRYRSFLKMKAIGLAVHAESVATEIFYLFFLTSQYLTSSLYLLLSNLLLKITTPWTHVLVWGRAFFTGNTRKNTATFICSNRFLSRIYEQNFLPCPKIAVIQFIRVASLQTFDLIRYVCGTPSFFYTTTNLESSASCWVPFFSQQGSSKVPCAFPAASKKPTLPNLGP